jgi:hypothetical protein
MKQPVRSFYKVTFDANLIATVTPLEDDKIWDYRNGGMDSSKPFILVNPGNRYDITPAQYDDSEEKFTNAIIAETKIVEKGISRYIDSAKQHSLKKQSRQYLCTINKTSGDANFDLIEQHNKNPDGFTTEHATEQARLIYGPLITKNGIDKDGRGEAARSEFIIQKLAKVMNYNTSYGTITANCQINALVAIMRNLKIPEQTIKKGIEGMRRLDCPNMAVHPEKGIFPSTVIFESSNDKLAEGYSMGNRKPPIPQNHVNMDVVKIDDNRIKIYQRQPDEVYNPRKKPSEKDKEDENIIWQALPEEFNRKVTDEQETIKNKILGYMGYGFRVIDETHHNNSLVEATPSKQIPGRDHNLVYKLMADMHDRSNARDVTSFQKKTFVEIVQNQKGLSI